MEDDDTVDADLDNDGVAIGGFEGLCRDGKAIFGGPFPFRVDPCCEISEVELRLC